jgi:trehalose 6-phosphate phosphatase
VERKGLSLAVHYREAPDPAAAEAALVASLSELATATGLHLMPGKRVLELAAGRPSKGGLVERLARERAAHAVLFAGDDVADLDAFDALDRLAEDGVDTLRVAVRGPETPQPLLDRADLQVLGPGGLVSVLAQLAGPASS